ncbi:alpha/beta-hydrolase [Apiospora saccharicola]
MKTAKGMDATTSHNITYGEQDQPKRIHYLAAGPREGPLILFIHGRPAIARTWQPQIDAFAAQGFRVLAPDMPGYGKSTARKVATDYCMEELVKGMLALLADTGRPSGIWVGHDYGAGVTSSIAAHHPEAVAALVNICVPYRTVELGLSQLLALVNREVYPETEFPYGQWDYQKHFEESFEKVVEWKQPSSDLLESKPPTGEGRPLTTATTTVLEPEYGDVLDEVIGAMQETGFWPSIAYYVNHDRNHGYNARLDGKLDKPALFIHATYDYTCDTMTSRLAEPMRQACTDLTEAVIEAGHWVQTEKPDETNEAIARFIRQKVAGMWPGSPAMQA